MIRKGLGARKTSGASQVKGATEEERLGLVKGDTRTGRQATALDHEDEDYDRVDDEDEFMEDKMDLQPSSSPDRDLTPPRRGEKEREKEIEAGGRRSDDELYERRRRQWDSKPRKGDKDLPPPPFDDGNGDDEAFI
jgi:hypothetical protein